MSTAQKIPQPVGVGPGQVFTSTEDASPGPTISAIGNPGPPPMEVPMHTGATDTLDITVTRQYIPIDTITWSTTNPKGQLLWYRPIHPNFAHQILSYLSKMYNTWGGGIDFNFKIAGTGFHAGAVAIVRIPPNRHPEEFTTPASWGPFEWMVIDPKKLEVESAHVIDQRNVMYHYQPFDEKNTQSFGGWIAMYVLLPLNTSSSGSQNIQIQSFVRPSATFQFSQLITPNLPKADVTSPYLTIQSAMNTLRNSCIHFKAISDIIIQPATVTSVRATGVFDRDAKPLFNINKSVAALDTASCYTSFFSAPGAPIVGNINGGGDLFSPLCISLPDAPKVKCVAEVRVSDDKKDVTFFNFLTTEPFKGLSQTEWKITQQEGGNTGSVVAVYIAEGEHDWASIDEKMIAPVIKESIVQFKSCGLLSASTCGIQLRQIDGSIKEAVPSNSTCVLMVGYDVASKLPIGYFKLAPNGLITAAARQDAISFPSNNIRFEYDSYITAGDKIPENVAMTQNLMLTQATKSMNYSVGYTTSLSKAWKGLQ